MRKLLTEKEDGGRTHYARARLKMLIFPKRLQIAQKWLDTKKTRRSLGNLYETSLETIG